MILPVFLVQFVPVRSSDNGMIKIRRCPEHTHSDTSSLSHIINGEDV